VSDERFWKLLMLYVGACLVGALMLAVVDAGVR
jgi:hypothetical protein